MPDCSKTDPSQVALGFNITDNVIGPEVQLYFYHELKIIARIRTVARERALVLHASVGSQIGGSIIYLRSGGAPGRVADDTERYESPPAVGWRLEGCAQGDPGTERKRNRNTNARVGWTAKTGSTMIMLHLE